MAKRCKVGPKLLLITNRKLHIAFQITCKSSTLDDLEGQYCNKNCIGCSMSLGARCFYCEIYLKNLCMIFSLFIYFFSYLYHLAR